MSKHPDEKIYRHIHGKLSSIYTCLDMHLDSLIKQEQGDFYKKPIQRALEGINDIDELIIAFLKDAHETKNK